MTTAEPGQNSPGAPASTPEERVATLIIQGAERAAQMILDAAEHGARIIAEAAVSVPTALATPAPITQGYTPEQIADLLMQREAAGNQYGPGGLPLDLTVDQLEDEWGNRIAPDWAPPGEEAHVTVPDPDRPMSAGIAPGQSIAPGIPRLDING